MSHPLASLPLILTKDLRGKHLGAWEQDHSASLNQKALFSMCHLMDYKGKASHGPLRELKACGFGLSHALWHLSPSAKTSILLSGESHLPAPGPSGSNWNLYSNSKLFQNKSDFASINIQLFPHNSRQHEGAKP